MRTEITKRARIYGYLIWMKDQDPEMLNLLGAGTEILKVNLGERFLGQKHVDWKYRRISLGYKHTRALPAAANEFIVSKKGDGSLQIKWK